MQIFEVIADPGRREILSALAEGSLSAGEVAALFPVSRPAVSRHLRVLREAGLVHDELVGRRRVYRLDAAGLTPVAAWLSSVTGAVSEPSGSAGRSEVWSGRIDALETEVRRTRRERRSASTPGEAPQSTAQKETA